MRLYIASVSGGYAVQPAAEGNGLQRLAVAAGENQGPLDGRWAHADPFPGAANSPQQVRERERDIYIYIFIYININIYTHMYAKKQRKYG